jgi:hypothetical protein
MNAQETGSPSEPVWIAVCCLAIILALVVGVGVASGLFLHHLVQTLPLWVGVGLGFGRSRAAGWIGLPLFLFWLVVMVIVWLYLFGIVHFINGHFSTLEIAVTIVVAVASVVGIAMFWRLKSALSMASGAALFIVFGLIQWVCFRAGFLPAIALR